ncbi:MAG: sulfatase-like hydrolase/transferase [Thermomonas sp.]
MPVARPAPFKPVVSAILFVACSIAFAILAWTWDRAAIGVAWEAYATPSRLFANALPGLLFAMALLALTRRIALSFAISCGVYWLVYCIEGTKLEILGDPIGLQDFFFFSNIDIPSLKLFWEYVQHPFLALSAGALCLLAIVFAWRMEPPAYRTAPARLPFVLVPLVLAFLLARGGWPWDRLYSTDTVMPARFSEIPAVLHAGQVPALVFSSVRSSKTIRAIDEDSLEWLLAHAPPRTKPMSLGGKPDVVVVLSESFFDPHVIKGMDALPDNIPNVREAISSGHGGYMRVPTFGGGTIRTEFEVLTGVPMRSFPGIRFPYAGLVHDRTPGLVRLLKSHGYRAVAIHGNAGSFWNRNNAFKSIGFDGFITERDFPNDAEHDGKWISDRAMTDLLIRELDRSTQPTMIFAISIEAHGPYTYPDESTRQARDAIEVPAGITAAQASALRVYLYHQRHADREFGRLLQALRQRQRPTVLLFFGDHLPGFPSLFDALGTVDKRPAVKQYVPWVLLRTDSPGIRFDGYRESWMLPGAVAELAGLPDDYFALTQRLAHAAEGKPAYVQGKVMDGLTAAATARLDGSFERRAKGHPGKPAGRRRQAQ